MELDLNKTPECDLVVGYINSRFRKGLNTNLYIIGLSGTGKSSTSQRLGELITESREVKPEVFIVDSLLELLKSLKSSKEGDIIIIEEVSVLFPSRRAMAQENVAISKVMDTCRKRLLCIISNAPLWTSIDNHMRAMGHLIIETLSINKTQKVVHSKFHRLQTNPLSSKTYRHTMERDGRDVSLMFTRMPNKEKWDEYEKDKDKFMDQLYTKLEFEQKLKEKKLDKQMAVVKPNINKLTPLELQVHQLVNVEGMKQIDVATKLGKHNSQISTIMKNIRKKSVLPSKNGV